ncbi:integrase [Clostridia bacterium]|nr:integrase [Clostridia bacterium]
MTNFREILRLSSLGINNSQIARNLDCSRQTVVSALQKAREIGLTFSEAVGMSDHELYSKLTLGERLKPTYKMPDYDYVHKEMAKSGVTLSLLWVEYCEACRGSGEIPYQSTQFNKYYSDYVRKTNATKHIHRKPGEIMEVDWAGQTADIIDSDTGEIIPASVFVAALPYSGYGYVEAFLSQNQECWIAGHVNAYRYFDGATRILIPDNLKTGIIANTREEDIINKAYQEMAEHYGTAVIPARIRKPRDKSTVEGTVGIISTWILAALRNEKFFSITDLNKGIREKLEMFNHKEFQKKEGSRYIVFQDEKQFLLPLPRNHFELATWSSATVQFNYHIACDKQNYSVPFEYIGKKVDVRTTRNTVEVFFDGNRVCSHIRLRGRANQYSTMDSHMPPNHQKNAEWNGDRFRKWAKKIGSNTLTIIELFLSSYRVEQQSYKSCRALLGLSEKYSPERLETACGKALSYTYRPSLKSVQAILKSNQDLIIQQNETLPTDTSEYGFVRGANYYKREDDKC